MNNLRDRFLTFAETECKGNSALYYKLCIQVADDAELLSIAANSKVGQPVPNIFLAAVHYLLLSNAHHHLARYYPSIQKKYVEEIPFPAFKDFCIANENAIKDIVATRIVQTNVINRCAYLLPIFSKIIADEDRPTTIIDIGTSAGLTLNFDKYEYWYNDQKVFGDSKVIVKSDILGPVIPKIYSISHPVFKIGIDQNLIDPSDEDEILWLEALVWPDQMERFVAMEEALKLKELKDIKFVRGETILDFEREILKTDSCNNLIIYATHVLYQFTETQKNEFFAMIERVGQIRNVHFLAVEGISLISEKYKSKEIVIELTTYRNRQKTVTFIAETNGHGNWIRWK